MCKNTRKETVIDKIGNDYKRCGPRDIIKIKAPTGSGKSYFVFEILLDYAIKKEKQFCILLIEKYLYNN